MNDSAFDRQIEEARARLAALVERVRDSPEALAAVLPEATEALSVALEELQVADEELRRQHKELLAARGAVELERQRCRELFDFAPDAYIVTNTEGVIQEANRAAGELLARGADYLLGKPLALHIAKPHRRAFRDLVSALPRLGEAREREIAVQPYRQAPLPAVLTASVAVDAAGTVTGLRWMLRDISERRRAQAQVAESARILDGLMQHSMSPLLLLDPQFNFIRVNEAYARACAKQVEDFPGHNHFAWYPSEELEATFRRVVATKESWETEARPFTFPDHPEWGETYWDLSLTPLLDEQGEVEYLVFSLKDVTERVRQQQELDRYRQHLEELVDQRTGELRQSEERYRTVAEYTYDWEFWMRPDGSFAYVSPSVERVTGYPAQSFAMDRDLYHLIAWEEDAAGLLAHQQEAMGSDQPMACEFRIMRQDGQLRWMEHFCQAVYDAEGKFAGRRGSNRDITERKQAEAERERLLAQVQAERERLFSVLNLMPGYVCLLTPDYRFRFVNRRFIDLFGDPGEDLCYQYLFNRDTPCEGCRSFDCLPEGEPQHWQWVSPVEKVFDIYDYRLVDADGVPLVLEVGIDITEGKQAEAERERLLHDLQLERALFAAVVEQAPLGIVVGEAPSGKLVLSNAEVERIFRHPFIPSAGIEEYGAWRGRHADGRPYEPQEWPLARAIASGEVVRDEQADILRGDGTVGAISLNAAPVRDAEGNIIAGVVVFGDITYARWADEELRRHQDRLEALVDERTRELEATTEQLAEQHAFSEAVLDTAGALVVVLDGEGRIVRFNRACQELTGYDFEEVEGRPFWEFLLLPEEAEQVMANWQQLVNNLANRNENHWVTRSGERRLISFNNTVLVGPDGLVEYVISSGLDVTERRRLERTVQQANAYHRRLLETSLDPLVTIGADGKITDVNSATEQATGRSREELVGTDFSDYFTDPAAARAGYEQVFRDGQVRDYPLEILHRNGHTTPVLYNAAIYRDEAGEVAGVFAAARDITVRQEMERALRASEEKYRSLVNDANVVVLSTDSHGNITFFNPYAQRFFGYTAEEVLGRNVIGTIVPAVDGAGQDLESMMEEIAGRPEQFAYNENENMTKDGRRVWMAWSNQALHDDQGRTVGLLAIGADRTAQKQAEEMLREYRESLRSLASELALAEERERRRIAVGIHDHISQTLALCKMRLGSLRRSSLGLAWEEPLSDVEGLVDEVINHTRTLTFELSPPVLYELGLCPALEWVCERTTERFGLPCYFEGVEEPLPLAEDVRVALFQGTREALTNVVKHAHANRALLRVWRDEDNAYVMVEDDGVGFDSSRLRRAVREGPSFGLFHLQERLPYLGGRAEIESTPGHGTRVTLSAPLEK